MTPGTQGCSTVTVPPPWCPQTQPPVLPSTCLWLFTAQDFCPCWLWEWFLGDWNKSPEGREVFQCSEQRQSCWGCTLRNAGMASLAQDELQLPKGFFFFEWGVPKTDPEFAEWPQQCPGQGVVTALLGIFVPWAHLQQPRVLLQLSSCPRKNKQQSLLEKPFCHVWGAENIHLCI